MHFAFPPRKSSHPPPYAIRPARSKYSRRRHQSQLGLALLGILGIIYLSYRLFFWPVGRVAVSTVVQAPPGTPSVVIVTVLDENTSDALRETIHENRRAYASKHGYEIFYATTADYDVGTSPKGWLKIPAMRHAMANYPETPFFWYLGPRSLIINEGLSLETHLLEKSRLEQLMLKDIPVVPPDSVIKTSKTLTADAVNVILTQDKQGVSTESFVLRQGEWARFFLDAWFNPLYRSYNFLKADLHALEHLIQWHTTILSHLSFIPLTTINAYTQIPKSASSSSSSSISAAETEEVIYQDGDLVAHFVNCHKRKSDPAGAGGVSDDRLSVCLEEMLAFQQDRAKAEKSELKVDGFMDGEEEGGGGGVDDVKDWRDRDRE